MLSVPKLQGGISQVFWAEEIDRARAWSGRKHACASAMLGRTEVGLQPDLREVRRDVLYHQGSGGPLRNSTGL